MLSRIPIAAWFAITTTVLLIVGMVIVWKTTGGAKAPSVSATVDAPIDIKPELYDKVVREDSWTRQGAKDAKVTVVEYGDFQCPACGAVYQPLKELEEEYKDKSVRFVYRHFPLTQIHPFAYRAAEAAEAAGDQGKFFEMHDKTYENQTKLTDDDLKSYAQAVVPDFAKWEEDFKSGKYRARVDQDMADANILGASSTPTFIVNNKIIAHGQGLSNLRAVIEAELVK